MSFLFFFAQETTKGIDVLSGGSGWTGVGLLGLVLGWLLLKHLPAKDVQIKEMIAGKDAQIKELVSAKDIQMDKLVGSFQMEAKELRSEFRDALNLIVKHCEDETIKVTTALRDELRELKEKQRP